MGIKGLFRDSIYDSRKITNGEDLIKAFHQMGVRHDDLAEICSVSKTMISHWGNPSWPEKPTYKQLEPELESYGKRRFKCELEPLSPAAFEYRKVYKISSSLILMIVLISAFWFSVLKPCVDNWADCKSWPWYKMGAFHTVNFNEAVEELEVWKEESFQGTKLVSLNMFIALRT